MQEGLIFFCIWVTFELDIELRQLNLVIDLPPCSNANKDKFKEKLCALWKRSNWASFLIKKQLIKAYF